jgi:hypothetical protein
VVAAGVANARRCALRYLRYFSVDIISAISEAADSPVGTGRNAERDGVKSSKRSSPEEAALSVGRAGVTTR